MSGYRPRLKLFLSADIIGSTAYKQPLDFANGVGKYHGRWADTIQRFYKTLIDAFSQHWQAARNELLDADPDALLGQAPRFWKTIGDEVVFWKELGSSVQLWFALSCWLKTIESVRDSFGNSEDDAAKILDVKCTAWVAGFPVRNRAVVFGHSDQGPIDELARNLAIFYAGPDSGVAVDFIGPGIDIGFRLSSLSSSRKMFTSLDLAYVLAKSVEGIDRLELDVENFFPSGMGGAGSEFSSRLCIRYAGNEVLKGVLGGIRYPKLWISAMRHDSLDAARVALYDSKQTGVEWKSLVEFCDRFYQDRSKFITKPFIENDEFVGEKPENFDQFLKAVQPRTQQKDFFE